MATEACRLVFSEADELPGLIVDRYGTLLLVQVLARGLDRPEVRALVTRVLVEELAPETIVERGDARIARSRRARDARAGDALREGRGRARNCRLPSS